MLDGIGEMIGSQLWDPGEFTDDTQMAVVQAESLLARGGVDGADLFKRFKVWSADAKDVGNQTSAVLGSRRGWDEAAHHFYRQNPNNSAGNGSLMRAAPTAVHFAAKPAADTVDAAHRTSQITHGDPAAGWGTALLHLMIRAALHGDDALAALDSGLADAAAGTGSLSRDARIRDWHPRDTTLPNGTVWTCLAQAVWAVRSNPDSFAGAITSAIDLGGDTDTVAAVAGALAGARLGIQAIPAPVDGVRPWTCHDSRRATHVSHAGPGADDDPPARCGNDVNC